MVEEEQPLHDAQDIEENFRARVFLLTNDNEWTDVATGVCRTDPPLQAASSKELDVSPSFTISILQDTTVPPSNPIAPSSSSSSSPLSSPSASPSSPDADKTTVLYKLVIERGAEVMVQQDTVLSWTRPDGSDVAVSFETLSGCKAVWHAICRFQGRMLIDPADAGPHTNSSINSCQLPETVEQGTLKEIEAVLKEACGLPFVRRSLAEHLVKEGYVRKLCEVFEDVENKNDLSNLQLLFSIFRSIVLLNSSQLLKEMLGEDNVMQAAGIFEYEPMLANTNVCELPKYRDYLKDSSHYRQIVPVRTHHLLSLIHETFRAQYFKDIILPRVLDDDTFTTLVMLIRSNHMEIIGGLEDEGELGEPLNKFVTFIERVLSSGDSDQESVVLAVDLLLAICQHDPQVLRSYVLENCKVVSTANLLSILIDCFLRQRHVGVRWQLTHLLRTLVDNSMSNATTYTALLAAIPPHASRIDDLLNVFYPHYAARLLQPFIDLDKATTGCNGLAPASTAAAMASSVQSPLPLLPDDDTLFHLCDLLIFFITAHKFRIKYLLLRSFIIQNVLLLLNHHRHTNPVLKAAALRVFRTMVATNDDFYYRFFVKHSSFRPIFALFRQVDGRNNLCESALFELFEAVRAGQSRILVNHLVEQHGKDLEGLKNNLGERLHDVYVRLNPSSHAASLSSDHQMQYFERLDDGDDDGEEEDGEAGEEEEGDDDDGDDERENGDGGGSSAQSGNDKDTGSGDNDGQYRVVISLPGRPYSPSKRSKIE